MPFSCIYLSTLSFIQFASKLPIKGQFRPIINKESAVYTAFYYSYIRVLGRLHLSLTYLCSPIVFLFSSVSFGTYLGLTYDLLRIDVVNRMYALWVLSSRRHPELIPKV